MARTAKPKEPKAETTREPRAGKKMLKFLKVPDVNKLRKEAEKKGEKFKTIPRQMLVTLETAQGFGSTEFSVMELCQALEKKTGDHEGAFTDSPSKVMRIVSFYLPRMLAEGYVKEAKTKKLKEAA